MKSLIKTKASSLQKVADLPRHRHPADLLNAFTRPIDEQLQQINGTFPFGKQLYINASHERLIKTVKNIRMTYRLASLQARQELAGEEYRGWNEYLQDGIISLRKQRPIINSEQEQHVYEAIQIAKQRHEQRLALHRFGQFLNEYSKGFKFDIELNPIILMKLVHPSFGYFNRMANQVQFKLELDKVIKLLQELVFASKLREDGYTLNSNEVLSLIMWRLFDKGNSRLTMDKFINMLEVFKFTGVTPDNIQQKFQYSLEIKELNDKNDLVRFELWRRIFLDKDL